MSIAKKPKVAEIEEWRITFDQTQGLRTLVDVVGNILTRVNFRIMYDVSKKTHFLCIDSIDPQHVCMIQARLVCERDDGGQEDITFCLESGVLNTCLKSVPSHYSLDLRKYSNSANIQLKAYETVSNSHTQTFELSTLVDDSETMQLTDMTYTFTIEIDLSTLRQIVKMSMSLRATQIDMIVNQPADPTDGRTTFTIASTGDATQSHNFNSATIKENDSNSCVIRAATDTMAPEGEIVDMLQKYKDTFSAQYLNFFLKSMERQIITMKLSQDKPLILHYPLGAQMSYICFVLAPQVTDV